MKQMKLSVKLVSSFAVVAAITLVVGFFGWKGTATLSDDIKEIESVQFPSVKNLMILEEGAQAIRVAQRTLLNPGIFRQDRDRQYRNAEKAKERIRRAWEVYEGLPKTAEEEKAWAELVPAWGELQKVNEEVFGLSRELEKTDILNPLGLRRDLMGFRGDHHALMNTVQKSIRTGIPFHGGDDPKHCSFGTWKAAMKTENPAIRAAMESIERYHDAFHHAAGEIRELVRKGSLNEAAQAFEKEMALAAEGVIEGFGSMLDEAAKVEGLYGRMNEMAMGVAVEKQHQAIGLLAKLTDMAQALAADHAKDAASSSMEIRIITLVGMAAGFSAALAFGIFLSISISGSLRRVIGGLSDGAGQVASASAQISSASQQVAEGSSEQASSLEETSSSLEELSSMTRQNAGNAAQANQLMKEASEMVDQANQAMESMTGSMAEISKASEETSKIIKTIDEIAFQTNLLALNAAVEAARAGQAGAGFAVVADEVRNLAMRAAEAAKNTAALIETTVKRVKIGSDLVTRTNEAFQKVAESASRVAELVGEIAAASGEQSRGIEQITRAVSEMDKVVQNNAATAEENAGASEEMNAQAEQMNAFVAELTLLVGGNGTGKNGKKKTGFAGGKELSLFETAGNPEKNPAIRTRRKISQDIPSHRDAEADPARVIPLDDEEIREF